MGQALAIRTVAGPVLRNWYVWTAVLKAGE